MVKPTRIAWHREAHVQEIRGIIELVLWINERLAKRIIIRHRGEGRHLLRKLTVRHFRPSPGAPGVDRTKHKRSAPMHLKSYQIDGKLLRTGAANFSASGLKRLAG